MRYINYPKLILAGVFTPTAYKPSREDLQLTSVARLRSVIVPAGADALCITAYHGRLVVENVPEPSAVCPYCGEER